MKGSLEAGMRIVAEDLLGRAQREVPRDEGTLAGSGSASVEVHGDRVVARVNFDTPYAKRQHEDVTLSHPKGGKAKYLEGPLTEMGPRYARAIGEVVKRGMPHGRP